MTTVFIGGSRDISRLPAGFVERLDTICARDFTVIVGDAYGTDALVQKQLLSSAYRPVVVFHSGAACRNNLGGWETRPVAAAGRSGFQFHAVKDREMARQADFGLMMWDGQSPGTLLNVLRLSRFGKKTVLFQLPDERRIVFRTAEDWDAFLDGCSARINRGLRDRLSPDDWMQPSPGDTGMREHVSRNASA